MAGPRGRAGAADAIIGLPGLCDVPHIGAKNERDGRRHEDGGCDGRRGHVLDIDIARSVSGTAFALSYPLPAYSSASPIASGMPVPVSALAVEAWIKPDTPAGDQIVVNQNGAFRLSIVKGPDAFHWQFMVGGKLTVTSSGPDDLLPRTLAACSGHIRSVRRQDFR